MEEEILCRLKVFVELLHKNMQQSNCINLTNRELKLFYYLFRDGYKAQSQTKISKEIDYDRSSVVMLLDTLEEKKLIVRRKNLCNRRENLIDVTEFGIEMYKQMQIEVTKNMKIYLDVLSESELEAFNIILKKLNDKNG